MHEFSIASEIWASVREAARQHGKGRVKAVKLEIGALNLIEEDQLRFWLEALAERDGSAGVELQITTLPPRARCGECGAQQEIVLLAEPGLAHVPRAVTCPTCGSANVTLEGGRELRVVSAEVEVRGEGRVSPQIHEDG